MRSNAHVAIFFFFNDTATTEIYPLSLHDALPISLGPDDALRDGRLRHEKRPRDLVGREPAEQPQRERHARLGQIGRAPSELQSQSNFVCRLLLEKNNHQAHTILTLARSPPILTLP